MTAAPYVWRDRSMGRRWAWEVELCPGLSQGPVAPHQRFPIVATGTAWTERGARRAARKAAQR